MSGLKNILNNMKKSKIRYEARLNRNIKRICEGHRVYECFDLKDIEWVRVEIITETKEKIVKLK
jgi:hypothetical protein